ncbi:hypothetical protein MASR2M78_14830 [Treponema sp.]
MDTNSVLIILAALLVAFFAQKRLRSMMTLGKLKKLIQEGRAYTILDVRTRAEHEERRIQDSLNVPLDRLQTDMAKTVSERQDPLFVYCLSGSRASVALGILRRMGYTSVSNLGGINAWQGAFDSGRIKKGKK